MHRRVAEQQRNPDRFIPRLLLLGLAVGTQHITMIGGKDENGIFFNSAFFQGIENIPDAVIQCGNMGIITGQLFPGILLQRLRDIGMKADSGRIKHLAIFLRSRFIGSVRRTPRYEQGKG